MLSTELALAHDIVGLFASADPYEDSDYVRQFAAFILRLDEVEAAHLDSAAQSAARMLASDAPRWRALGQVAALLDWVELGESLADGLSRGNDPAQIAVLASLAGSPRATTLFRERVLHLAEGLAHEPVRRVAMVRLGEEEPSSELEHIVAMQSFPGRYSTKELRQIAPVAYLSHRSEQSYLDVLRVSAVLLDAGFRIIRIAGQLQHMPDKGKASDAYPLVRWSGNADAQWRRLNEFGLLRTVQAPKDTSQDVMLRRLVARAVQALPEGFPLQGPDTAPLSRNAFQADTLDEGAFDAAEMLFLGGCSRTALQRYSREEELGPSSSFNQNYWDFSQLVTVRIVEAFRVVNPKFRLGPSIVLQKLHDIAVQNVQREVAIDVNGSLYFEEGGQFVAPSGQIALPADVLSVDRAFRSFKIGGGAVIPNLLHPSRSTSVDPVILGGTPAIKEKRISARAIAEMSAAGDDALRSAYPELDPLEILDAVGVGNRILAVR